MIQRALGVVEVMSMLGLSLALLSLAAAGLGAWSLRSSGRTRVAVAVLLVLGDVLVWLPSRVLL